MTHLLFHKESAQTATLITHLSLLSSRAASQALVVVSDWMT